MQGLEVLSGDELLVLARLDVAAERMDAALVKLKLARREGAGPDVMIELARVHHRLGLRSLARQGYEAVIALQNDDPLSQFELGVIEFEEENYPEAERLWKAVLKRSPDHPPALFSMALLRTRAGQASEAKHLLEKLLATSRPDNLYAERATRLLHMLHSGVGAGMQGGSGLAEMPVLIGEGAGRQTRQ